MPTRIEREQLQRLLHDGAQLVEVLPREEYDEAHLPGAISIPLKELTPQAAETLDRERPVITYCYDTQCDMSPRAAWRLESLGFGDVYHYAPGKADWLGAGLPIEGQASDLPMIGRLAHRDVPVCRPKDDVGQLRSRLEGSAWDSCFVLNEQGVVLGRVYVSQLSGAEGTAEELMDPGPSTYRPDLTAAEMAQRMQEADLETAPVTTSDGRLIGMVRREEVERAAQAKPPAPADQ
jgi:rhodanese-related sulfurtransferase/CBS domain-containing protein